jgi:hypothetical protein
MAISKTWRTGRAVATARLRRRNREITVALDEKRSTLNPSQRHRLLITCKHVDKLLGEIEETLNAAASKRLFMSYVEDITPQQRKTIEEYIGRIRVQLLEVLAGQSLAPEEPQISAAHSIHVALTFIEIAIAELAPRYMRGYGPVSEQSATALHRMVAELQSAVKELHRYLLPLRSAQL